MFMNDNDALTRSLVEGVYAASQVKINSNLTHTATQHRHLAQLYI